MCNLSQRRSQGTLGSWEPLEPWELELSEPCFWWWTVRSLANLENSQSPIQFNLIQCRGFITSICEESIPFADTVEHTSGELGMKLDTSMETVGVKNWMSELGSVSWFLELGTSATISWWQGLGLLLVSQLFCMLIIAQKCTMHWNCWLLFAEKCLKPVMGSDMMDSECEIVQQWLLQSSTEKVPKWLSNCWTCWRRTKQCSSTPLDSKVILIAQFSYQTIWEPYICIKKIGPWRFMAKFVTG